MVWVRHSDNFAEEMDAQGLSTDAVTLYVAGLCYCNRLENDGQIPRHKAPRLYTMDDPDAAIKELIAAGYWAETEAGYRVVGQYGEIGKSGNGAMQPSRASLEAKRADTARRTREWRERRRNGQQPASNPGDASDAVTGVTTGDACDNVPAQTRPGPTEGKGKGKGQGPGASPSAPASADAPALASGSARRIKITTR